jgi:hypothetical protein
MCKRTVLGARGSIPVLLMLQLLLLPGLARAAEPPGAASPQELVARMIAAAESGDFAEMAACMAPEPRREMAVMMVGMAGMMVAFMDMGAGIADDMAEAFSDEEMTAEQQAEAEAAQREAAEMTAAVQARYEAILRQHGLEEMLAEEEAGGPEGETDMQEMLEGVDEIALLRDLMGFLEEIGDEEEGSPAEDGPFEIPGEVGEIAIEGDRATANAGDDVLEFVRIDGRWYFEPPDESELPSEH